MASHREILQTLLKANAALDTAVGGRFYHARRPDKVAYPYIRFENVDTVPARFFGSDRTGQEDSRWQFNVFADTAGECESIISKLSAVLDLLETDVTIANPDDGVVTGKILGSRPASYRLPLPDPDTGKLHAVIDFRVVFGRSA